MDQKDFVNIILIILVIILAGTTGYFALKNYSQKPSYSYCTQEAKLCSDGSYVGRTGPNCEFAKCPDINPIPNPNSTPTPTPNPNPTPKGEQVSLKEGQREGSLLVEKIYPNYITGLNFPEYPLPFEKGFPITLHIGEMASNGCTITLTLAKIEGKIATFIEKTDFNRPCPICLAENTMIDTPNGALPVQNLKIGDVIWTVDKLGKKVSAKIIKTSKTPAPLTHQMVHIILDDQREIFASPGHPTIDGRTIGEFLVGESLDGSTVISTNKISYKKDYTYDILPSGETGFYFANGILIDSTLY